MISRDRVWHIVEAPLEGERADAFDVFILVLIALNVIAVVLQSIRSIDLRYDRAFSAFDRAAHLRRPSKGSRKRGSAGPT